MILIFFFLGVIALIGLNTRLYIIRPDECAVVTSFGRAQRLRQIDQVADSSKSGLSDEEQKRYDYPQLRTRGPGGPYLKLPWQRVYKVRVATEALDLCWDPSKVQENVEAVTKDNLTTDVRGQVRYTISKSNLYPFFFGVESPLEHVMGFFISVMRERLANFVAPHQGEPKAEVGAEGLEIFEGISINDIRKNLPLINRYMEEQCAASAYRYGIELDAALITEIDPPVEVDHALSAINTSKNQVAAEISTARGDAEQQITMSKRAVEIARNNAEAEVAPLRELASKLADLKTEGGSEVLRSYIRNFKIPLWRRAKRVIESI